MNDHIVCPHCRKSFPPAQGMLHQLEEERLKIRKEETEFLRKKIENELSLKLKDKENEAVELKMQNKKLQEQILETNKLLRQLQKQLEEKDLETQKKIAQEEERIVKEARKKAEEENRLKLLEMQKKMQEQEKDLEEMRRKLQQGSQQTQGEVFEEYLEQTLRRTFINDIIAPVPKGIRGADIIQTVRNNFGKTAGTVIWESKRTKTWSNDWVPKLKTDQRTVKAEIAVLVTTILPSDIKNFGYYNGIWISNYESIIGLAQALRLNLFNIAALKSSSTNTGEKKEALYEYVRSVEFKHRVEAIAEAFGTRLQDLEIEKRWFVKKWAKEEKTIRSLISNTDAMYADLQAILGKELGELKGLDMLPSGSEEVKKDKLF